MYIYIYIYIHIYKHGIRKYTHTHMCAHLCMYMHLCALARVSVLNKCDIFRVYNVDAYMCTSQCTTRVPKGRMTTL